MSPKFWSHARRERWTEDERTLAIYLLTCPHRTTEGFFRLPKPYIGADLGWDAKRLEKAFSTLSAQEFIAYDEASELLLIVNAMRYQRPDNENQQKAAVKALRDLGQSVLWPRFLSSAEAYAEAFHERLRKDLPEAFREGLAGQEESLRPPVRFSPAPAPTPAPAPKPEAEREAGGAPPPAVERDGDDPSQRLQDALVILQATPGWPRDDLQDRTMLVQASGAYPRADIVAVARSFSLGDHSKSPPAAWRKAFLHFVANARPDEMIGHQARASPNARPHDPDAGRLDTDEMRRELGLL